MMSEWCNGGFITIGQGGMGVYVDVEVNADILEKSRTSNKLLSILLPPPLSETVCL